MSKVNVDFSHFVRRFPASAPNTPSRRTTWALETLAKGLLYLSCIIYLPALTAAYFLAPGTRPPARFTLLQHIGIRLRKLESNILAIIGWRCLPQPFSPTEEWGIPADPAGDMYKAMIAQGKVHMEVVTLDPVEDDLRVGIARAGEGVVKSVPRAGYWISPKDQKSGTGAAGGKALLHIHGGGYIRGHPLWTPVPLLYVQTFGIPVLSINYRKCLTADSAFPAPLLDVLAGYLHLTRKLKYAAKDITVIGESAGSHLTLVLSRYLTLVDLPQPGKMVLISPWCDFKLSYPSYKIHAGIDSLSPLRLGRAVESAMRWYDTQARDGVWFSPSRSNKGDWEYLTNVVKVYVTVGTRELFEDEIRELASGMKADGVEVTLREHKDGIHTEILTDPAGREMLLKDLREFLDS